MIYFELFNPLFIKIRFGFHFVTYHIFKNFIKVYNLKDIYYC
jgi:hypothetical protein